MPAENLLQPDLLRRLCWTPPAALDLDGIAAFLRAGGARPWQVELVGPRLADGVRDRSEPPRYSPVTYALARIPVLGVSSSRRGLAVACPPDTVVPSWRPWMPTPRPRVRRVVFVDGVRTPFGRARKDGLYANTRADDLSVKTIRELLRRHPSLPPERVDEVAIAATTQQGDQGLTLGRTVGVLAGLPRSVPGYAIDRMCAGAMTAVTNTAAAIGVGAQDVALAGGVEHMGHHPMGFDADPNPRFLSERLVENDALNMGVTAENLHDTFPALTRERADAYGAASQAKYAAALAAGKIDPDLVPVALRDPENGWGLATADEPPRPGTTVEAIGKLPTPFRAGRPRHRRHRRSADRRCRLVPARRRGHRRRARAAGPDAAWSRSPTPGVEPSIMGIGPVPATTKALQRAGLTIDDIGLFEINEAFAVQVLSFLDAFGIADDDPRVNQYGGAIAVGHPLASSGVRLMLQLARQFADHPEVRYGLTTMCVGLGQGGTVIWENPHHPDYEPTDARRGERQVSDERVTHAHARDVRLPGGAGTLALVTLDNGLDHTKPTTLGPLGIAELTATLTALQARAAAGEIVAVAVTGKPYFLAAGADLLAGRHDHRPRRGAGVRAGPATPPTSCCTPWASRRSRSSTAWHSAAASSSR